MRIKDIARKILLTLKIDLTISLKYDRLTNEIIKLCVNKNTLCVDIGCHKGEIMDLLLSHSPDKKHYGFEPIPFLFDEISHKYAHRCKIFDIALSDSVGTTTFNYVKNAPAYSGIKQRKYLVEKPDIELLEVKLDKLDNIIPVDERVDFIKIDVEGAEYSVLKGATETISRNKPVVLFEFGKGASDYYDTDANDIYNFFDEKGMSIFLLQDWINKKPCLSRERLNYHYEGNSEFYFIACASN